MENLIPAVAETPEPSNTTNKIVPPRRSVAERRRIVEASLAPGATVAKVAAKYGIQPTHLSFLRKQYREGKLGPAPKAALLAVQVIPPGDEPKAGKTRESAWPGQIELELPRGQVRIMGQPAAETIRLVLDCVLR